MSQSPKPIFIVKLPRSASQEDLDRVGKQLQEKMPDYHILTLRSFTTQDPKFQVFYEKDFNEVKFEELKQIARDSLKEQQL